ncbi:hypothetical protein GCM10018965_047240 [Nonomuraea roseola]
MTDGELLVAGGHRLMSLEAVDGALHRVALAVVGLESPRYPAVITIDIGFWPCSTANPSADCLTGHTSG